MSNILERVSCPFDPVHVIEPRRLQAHIIKCKKNLPPNHDFVECQFWHLHFVRRSQLEEHYASCEHRLSKEAAMRMWEAVPSPYAQPKLVVDERVEQWHCSEESWDNFTGPSFQYDQQKQKAPHMMIPEGLSKAKRKEFREKERARLRELEDKKPKISIKKEVKEDQSAMEFNPPPRKPDNLAVRGSSSRIAAKFPVQVDGDNSSKSAPFSYAKVTEHSVIGGKGRGVLGKSREVELGVGYQFLSEQFPELN